MKKRLFLTPASSTGQHAPNNVVDEDPSDPKCFTIVFAKLKRGSKTKGSWLDGVLVLNNNSCIIYNEVGKLVLKSMKITGQEIREDATFVVRLEWKTQL